MSESSPRSLTLSEALTNYKDAAAALRDARAALETAEETAGASAYSTLTSTEALETFGELFALVIGETCAVGGPHVPVPAPDRQPRGYVNVLGATVARSSPEEKARLNRAMTRGQARALASCPCGTCGPCAQAEEWRAEGRDPETMFYETTLARQEPSRLVAADGRSPLRPDPAQAIGRRNLS